MSDATPQSDHVWSQEQIAAYLAGGLSAAEAERLESHARECPACAAALDTARRLDHGLGSLFAGVRPGPELEDRAIQKFRTDGVGAWKRSSRTNWRRRAFATAAAIAFLGTFGAMVGSIVGDGRLPMPGNAQIRTPLRDRILGVLDEDAVPPTQGTDGSVSTESGKPGSGKLTLPDGMDLVSLPVSAGSAIAGFVTPGSKVDVLASLRVGNKLIAFPLLVDQQVLAVDTLIDTTSAKTGSFPNLEAVSLAATPEQALLLTLAKQRGCYFELLKRDPNKQVDSDYDMRKIKALLQDEKSSATVATEGRPDPSSNNSSTTGLSSGGLGGGGFGHLQGLGGLGGGGPGMPSTGGIGGISGGIGGIGGINGGIGGIGGGINGIGGIGGFGGMPMGQPQQGGYAPPVTSAPIPATAYVPPPKLNAPASKDLTPQTYFQPNGSSPAPPVTPVTPANTTGGQPNPMEPSAKKDPDKHDPKDQKAGGGDPNQKKDPDPPGAPDPGRRIVIRSGDMEFEVESFDAALVTITKLVTGIKGGFVATVNSEKLPNGKVKGSVTVRMPPEALDALVLELRKELGKMGELKGVKISSQDITKMYFDMESRLRAARTMETRLLQIIKEGKGEIKQLLEAERELGTWRTKIEELEGEIRYYSNLASLSTLTITLSEKEIRAAAGLIEKERVQAGVEVEDVDKAYQQVLTAIVEAKGRVTKSELKQLSAGQFSASLNFEVAPEAAGPIRDRLRQLGRVARLEIDRVQQADGTLPSDAKLKHGDTVFLVQLYNLANIAPRETATLQLAVADVPNAYQNLRDEVAKTTGGRVLVAQLNEQDKQNITAQFDFEVKRTEEGKIRAAIAAAGEVVSRQVVRSPESDSVTDVKVLYRATLLASSRLRPRETATFQIAVSDVSLAYQALRDAVGKTPSRVINAQFDEQDKQNASAQFDFEVKRGEEAAVRAALDATGEVVSRQVTRAPEADGLTDSKILYRATLLGANRLRSRDTATVQVAVLDVPPAYQALREAIGKANGRILAAQIDEHDKQNITAQVDFEVKRADELAMRAALDAAGEVIARQVTRATEGDGVTDTKVTYRVALLPANRLKPRETMTLAVEVAEVEQTAFAFGSHVAEVKGRQVDARINREPSGKVTAHLIYDVPLTAAPGLAAQFRSAGTVRVQQSARDPLAPDGKYATARLDVSLTSADQIVAADAGVWPQVRRGLTYSASVLLTSITWVVFGLCVVLPWALLGYGGYRTVRWMARPTGTSTPPAPPTAPPSPTVA